jgi:hypothetical protein
MHRQWPRNRTQCPGSWCHIATHAKRHKRRKAPWGPRPFTWPSAPHDVPFLTFDVGCWMFNVRCSPIFPNPATCLPREATPVHRSLGEVGCPSTCPPKSRNAVRRRKPRRSWKPFTLACWVGARRRPVTSARLDARAGIRFPQISNSTIPEPGASHFLATIHYGVFSKSPNVRRRSAPVPGRSNFRRPRAHGITESLQLADMAVAGDGHTPYFEHALAPGFSPVGAGDAAPSRFNGFVAVGTENG